MESLLATYGSDDEDEGERASPLPQVSPLPQSKCAEPIQNNKKNSSLLFSVLPPPKSNKPKPGRIVEFRPPIDMSVMEEQRPEKQHKRKTSSSKGSLSGLAMALPPPKHTGGALLGGGSGGGRRSAMQLEEQGVEYPSEYSTQETEYSSECPTQDVEYAQQNTEHSEVPYNGEGVEYSQAAGYFGEYSSNDVEYSTQAQHSHDAAVEEDVVTKALKAEKRKGKEGAITFIQVKQDDLTANRPREDLMRMTGIAFGGFGEQTEEDEKLKPSKLQKRKHQIGSLYYDMKQNEMDLMERRARGQLSKMQTQAKYGW